MKKALLPLLTMVVALAACRDGASGDPDADGGTDTDGEDSGDETAGESGGDDGIPAGCEGEDIAGLAPLRRLTHWEFDNTIHDLLGDDTRHGEGFPTENSATSFNNQASNLGVSPLLAEEYLRATEAIAATAVSDLHALLPCESGDGEDNCAAAFIDDFGPRAFRRPLTEQQRDDLLAFYDTNKADHGFDAAIELLIQRFLQSPYFLYRVELGMAEPDDTGAIPLDDYELASRLSYLLWGSMPDDELFAAAEAGDLQDPDGIAAQAERMLGDPRARAAVASFHRQWLQLDTVDTMNKDASVITDLDDELRASLKDGTVAFLEHVVFDGAGDLTTALTAEYTFADDTLAPLYGVPSPGSSTPVRVDLPEGQRAGLLTEASVLALTAKPNQTSPVIRGAFIQARLRCETLPEPPPDVDVTPPEVDPNATTRDRWAQHSADPLCAGCHQIIDPLGFGLEHYDAMGRWRDDENGLPIDASGTIVDGDDANVDFDGALELAQILSSEQAVRECFVEQWFTFAHGRAPEEGDNCSIDSLRTTFEESDNDIPTLLIELTRTPSFRYRPG